jgi:hypothetical protein
MSGRTVRKRRATKNNFPNGSNHEHARAREELDKRQAARTVRAHQTDCPPGADRATQARKREQKFTYLSMDLPNGLSS